MMKTVISCIVMLSNVYLMSAKGNFNSATPPDADKPDTPQTAGKEFVVIVAGDSDFITNYGIRIGMNRDLGLNVVGSLLKESDMVTIRPKQPMGSMINMTQAQFMILLFGFIIPLPLLLFSLGGFVWWRRRAA